jgi:threonine dehydrogenase-like Zn-dependent dehydrogenase
VLATLDRIPERRERSLEAGSQMVLDPVNEDNRSQLYGALCRETDRPGADLVFELSGNPSALNEAVSLAGYGGRIVVGSWYGEKPATLDLGGRFHRNRISIISSQVSTIDPWLSGRWTKGRRMNEVLRLLPALDLEGLITHRFPFCRAADAFHLLDWEPASALQVLLNCDDQTEEHV